MNERYLTLSLGREPTTERAVVAQHAPHDLVARALRRGLSGAAQSAPTAARRRAAPSRRRSRDDRRRRRAGRPSRARSVATRSAASASMPARSQAGAPRPRAERTSGAERDRDVARAEADRERLALAPVGDAADPAARDDAGSDVRPPPSDEAADGLEAGERARGHGAGYPRSAPAAARTRRGAAAVARRLARHRAARGTRATVWLRRRARRTRRAERRCPHRADSARARHRHRAAAAPPRVPAALHRQGVSFAGSMITVRRDPVPGVRADRLDAGRRPARARGARPAARHRAARRRARRRARPPPAGARRRLASLLVLSLAAASRNALLADPQVWVLFVVAAGMSAAGGLQRPPLDAMLPRLVPREELPRRPRSTAFRGNAARSPGRRWRAPDRDGRPGRDVRVDAATFLVSLVALARMRAVPPPPRPRRRASRGSRGLALRPLAPGADRAATRVDINAMLFGDPGRAVPAVADRLRRPGAARAALRRRARRRGAVHARQRLGRRACARHGQAIALSAGATAARDRRVRRSPARSRSRSSRSPPPARRTCHRASSAQTLWNQTIPDHMRGRLAGIEQLSYSIGPTLGTTRSGASPSSRASASRSSQAARLRRRHRRSSARCCRASGATRPRDAARSVPEVAAVGEDHRDAGRVGGLDDLEVALASRRAG